MTVGEKLASLHEPESWNHPRWLRYGPPLCAGLGAVLGTLLADSVGTHPPVGAGLGGAIAVLLAFPVLALFD